MRERQDFTGQIFGRLEVIGTEVTEDGKTLQVCRCSCDSRTIVKGHTCRLKNGTLKSCGCISAEKARARMLKDGAGIARRYQLSKPLKVSKDEVFGRLTVIGETDLMPDGQRGKNRRAVLCQCACGNKVSVWVKHLLNGHIVSCGCFKDAGTKKTHGQSANRAHGIKGTGEYNSWIGCVERCYNPINPAYLDYGLMGIGVCDRWRKSFIHFYEDMGPKPSKEHSLDRYPDKKGNYEPSNCRWASKSEQAANRTYYTQDEKTERLRKHALHLIQEYLKRSGAPLDKIELCLKSMVVLLPENLKMRIQQDLALHAA